MKRVLILFLSIFGLIIQPVRAETVAPPPPHEPSKARCNIQGFVDAITAKDLAQVSKIKIYADEVGRVSSANADEFFATFDVGTSLTKRDPLLVRKVAVLEINSVSPIYLASVERKYAEERYWAVWLFQFKTNEITVARRADELWPLLERGAFAFSPCESANG